MKVRNLPYPFLRGQPLKGLSSTIKSVLIMAILNKRTGGATSFIAPKRAGWRPRLVGVSRFRQFSSN